MSYLTTVHVDVEMAAPAPPDLKLSTLRRLWAMKWEEVRALYPAAEHLHLTLVFYCDLEQRVVAEDLPGFVPARRLREATRLDWGFCECFRFKWKHLENREVVRG